MRYVMDWNGIDVPTDLRALPKGRYVVVPIDDAPELTEERDGDLQDAIESIRHGEGVLIGGARRHLAERLRR